MSLQITDGNDEKEALENVRSMLLVDTLVMVADMVADDKSKLDFTHL